MTSKRTAKEEAAVAAVDARFDYVPAEEMERAKERKLTDKQISANLDARLPAAFIDKQDDQAVIEANNRNDLVAKLRPVLAEYEAERAAKKAELPEDEELPEEVFFWTLRKDQIVSLFGPSCLRGDNLRLDDDGFVRVFEFEGKRVKLSE